MASSGALYKNCFVFIGILNVLLKDCLEEPSTNCTSLFHLLQNSFPVKYLGAFDGSCMSDEIQRVLCCALSNFFTSSRFPDHEVRPIRIGKMYPKRACNFVLTFAETTVNNEKGFDCFLAFDNSSFFPPKVGCETYSKVLLNNNRLEKSPVNGAHNSHSSSKTAFS